jgi:hypothetical protein
VHNHVLEVALVKGSLLVEGIYEMNKRRWNLVMNLIFVAKSGIDYISFIELIWRKCENQSEGERLGTHGRHLGLH